VLLAKINALCDPKKGCWASNRWLANWWGGRDPSWVSTCITKFRELGLVEVKLKDNNKRMIRVTFFGDELPTEKTRHPHRENSAPPPRKLGGQQSTTIKSTRERTHPRLAPADGSVPSLGLNGGHKLPKLVKEFANFAIENHLHLGKRGSTTHGWTRATLLDWEKRLNELLSQLNGDSHQVGLVLQWYFEHWRDEYVPQVYTLRSFCERYPELKRAMKRSGGGEPDDIAPVGHWETTLDYEKNGKKYTTTVFVRE